MTHALEWQFGGLLRNLPATVAWSLIGVLAIAGLVFVIWSYQHTLRQLSPQERRWLTCLRAAIVLALLLCLANPTRVEKAKRADGSRDTLAVLVDRSASMNSPDHRGTTRLASAVRLWKQHENEARETFAKISYQRFSVGLNGEESLDSAVNATEPGPETHLYAALRETLATNPAAIVCLTDGLDTTPEAADEITIEAQQRGVPIYFVAGQNRAHAAEMVSIREVKAPAQVLRQTKFYASVLIQVGAARDGELPVELWNTQRKVASTTLPIRAGLNTIPWSVALSAVEPGRIPIEFRVGGGVGQQISTCTTQVVDHTKINLLYYQGALQWGYRFLLAALQSDPSFQMTSILNPALGIRMNTGVSGQPAVEDLPEDARELAQFQIVVLAHVFASQLSPRQQQALVDYVKAGGSVLFIAPDSNAASQFAGTAIERMLPVVFDLANKDDAMSLAENAFRNQMAASDGRSGEDALLDDNRSRHGDLPILQPFALPRGAARSKTTDIFRNADPSSMPRFCEHARVRALKPGAELLAVSSFSGPDGAKFPLLARQQFGNGYSAALTTDLLWRWKMALPSSSHAAEKFWQQLLISLVPEQGHGLRLVKTTESASVHVPVALRIDGSDVKGEPSLTILSPSGHRKQLTLQKIPSADGAQWNASFTPEAAGKWEGAVQDSEGNYARLSFPVTEKPQTLEMSNLPPNLDSMRQLAESTGGALIGEDPVFQKRDGSEEDMMIQQSKPVWNSSWLLALLLGLYGSELVVRRRFKLL